MLLGEWVQAQRIVAIQGVFILEGTKTVSISSTQVRDKFCLRAAFACVDLAVTGVGGCGLPHNIALHLHAHRFALLNPHLVLTN